MAWLSRRICRLLVDRTPLSRLSTAVHLGSEWKDSTSTTNTVTLFVGNLPHNLTNAHDKIRELFSSKGIQVTDLRLNSTKRFCYVDLADPSDKTKGTLLNGTNVNGYTIKVDVDENKPLASRGGNFRENSASFDQGSVPAGFVSLFIGNLPEDTGDREKTLREFFASHGIEIGAVRSNPLKRFCHADLSDPSQRTKALGLSGADFYGTAIRIDAADNRPPGGRPSFPNNDHPPQQLTQHNGRVTLFIGNLPEDTGDREDKLRDLLASRGIKITEIRSDNRKRFCHVDLADPSHKSAGLELSGTNFNGSVIRVGVAENRPLGRDMRQLGPQDGTTTIFVGNLPEDTGAREELIRELFASRGIELTEVRSNPLKRFCHVDLEQPSDAQKALKLDGAELGGLAIKITLAQNRPFNQRREVPDDSMTLFVGNLPDGFGDTEEKIRELFASYGIQLADVRSNSRKGFCHVDLTDPSDRLKGMKLNGMDFEGRRLKVSVAYNKPLNRDRDY